MKKLALDTDTPQHPKSAKTDTQTKKPSDSDKTTADTSVREEPMPRSRSTTPTRPVLIGLAVLAIALGSLTGWGTHRLTTQSKTPDTAMDGSEIVAQVAEGEINDGDVFGNPNTEIFKDFATGYLTEGGLEGEGSHSLLRPGGVSQTVYLTSSVTDLDKFVGMEVQVAGETFRGQKAGWLMDVGQVKIIATEAEAPVQ